MHTRPKLNEPNFERSALHILYLTITYLSSLQLNEYSNQVTVTMRSSCMIEQILSNICPRYKQCHNLLQSQILLSVLSIQIFLSSTLFSSLYLIPASPKIFPIRYFSVQHSRFHLSWIQGAFQILSLQAQYPINSWYILVPPKSKLVFIKLE